MMLWDYYRFVSLYFSFPLRKHSGLCIFIWAPEFYHLFANQACSIKKLLAKTNVREGLQIFTFIAAIGSVLYQNQLLFIMLKDNVERLTNTFSNSLKMSYLALSFTLCTLKPLAQPRKALAKLLNVF